MTSNGFGSADFRRESVGKQHQRVDVEDDLNRELDDTRELLGKKDRLRHI